MKNVIERINEDIFERSMKHNFKELEKMGESSHEFEYRKCKSSMDGMEDYYFVVSKKLKYHNGSMIGYDYVTYAYDKNGKYIDQSQEVYKMCKGGFFKTLVDI
jgi:hypothetical protein